MFDDILEGNKQAASKYSADAESKSGESNNKLVYGHRYNHNTCEPKWNGRYYKWKWCIATFRIWHHPFQTVEAWWVEAESKRHTVDFLSLFTANVAMNNNSTAEVFCVFLSLPLVVSHSPVVRLAWRCLLPRSLSAPRCPLASSLPPRLLAASSLPPSPPHGISNIVIITVFSISVLEERRPSYLSGKVLTSSKSKAKEGHARIRNFPE